MNRPTSIPPKTLPRSSGVLLHVTSLPGPFGVGDLGPAAYRWVDVLARAKQTWWQVLPLGPPGAGDSPYQCYSAFAGNPLLISPELLRTDGLLSRSDLTEFESSSPAGRRANGSAAAAAAAVRWKLLTRAYERFVTRRPGGSLQSRIGDLVTNFWGRQHSWLTDYALFMSLREAFRGASWHQWPKPLMMRDPAALEAARLELGEATTRHYFVQCLFFRQLNALRDYARSKGVRLIGDLPIFVSPDSADVWANPHLFLLDRRRRPKAVAGVPPDYFSKTGQRWGNPLYDWDAMKRDGYGWWVERLRASLNQADLVRIDHFRGFEAYWKIPASSPTAVKGRWTKAPGEELFHTVAKRLGGLPFIAEDLGVITPEVEALRDRFGLPGMRVLQFAFGGGGGGADNPFLPHNYPRNAVAYTGTHDNDTTAGWYAALKAREKERVRRYAGGLDRRSGGKDVARAMLRLAWSSVADLAIAPLQDVLGLGPEARMNVPGKPTGNWRWRFTWDQLTGEALETLADLTQTYGREARR